MLREQGNELLTDHPRGAENSYVNRHRCRVLCLRDLRETFVLFVIFVIKKKADAGVSRSAA
jgi:hypothetical protein